MGKPATWREVDFLKNPLDLQCYILACAGWSTKAIFTALRKSGATGLTENQITYRLGKAEKSRRENELTMRGKYRAGKSPINDAVFAMVTAQNGFVRKTVAAKLDQRGLYETGTRGVLKDNKTLPKTTKK